MYTVRKAIKLAKHPRRVRLTIDCDAATIARFDKQRGSLSRREFLDELLDLADGELPY